MNVPFELGIDYGCRLFGPGSLREKKSLVLEKDRFDYQKALSDLSGVDIKKHDNEPRLVVRALRDWFVETVGLRSVASASSVWYRFSDFASDFYDRRQRDGFSADDLNMMPIPEYIDFIDEWVDRTKS
jgi:hypothetical protein